MKQRHDTMTYLLSVRVRLSLHVTLFYVKIAFILPLQAKTSAFSLQQLGRKLFIYKRTRRDTKEKGKRYKIEEKR